MRLVIEEMYMEGERQAELDALSYDLAEDAAMK